MISLLKKRKITACAMLLMIVIMLCAMFPNFLAPFEPNDQAPEDRLIGFSVEHPMGTDKFGRDILSRVIVGSRMSMLSAVGIVVFSLVLGTLMGLVAGYVKWLSGPIMRIVDAIIVFPPILLAMLFIVILGGSGVTNIIIAVGIYYTTRMARVVYGLTLKIKEEVFITAARSLGAGNMRVMIKHILPNLLSPLIVQSTYTLSGALLQIASLDYLGLGISREIPTWGNMLNEGSAYLMNAPWIVIYPGFAIVLCVLSCNLIGDALRDHLDPKFREVG